MRKMWLKNITTGEIWDLLPDNPNLTDGGCALIDPNGLGYQQRITQEQVEVDYYIKEIQSENASITGKLFFNGDEHYRNFQRFLGDFRRLLYLYYSPDGQYEPYDAISSAYYKPVTVTAVLKEQKDQFGWYECDTTFSTQSDVWKRDVYLYIDGERKAAGEPLVYPYSYSYTLGGRDVYAIDIPNSGRETGCLIKIKNRSDRDIRQVEWFIDHTYVDEYNVEHKETQRAKWYTENADIVLKKDYELYVDSNPITQEARVNYPDRTSQSVVRWQEPSYDYINFIRIKHGANLIVFYIDGDNVDISVTYREQKELI